MHRLSAALLLIIGALILAAWLYYPVAQPRPAAVTARERGGTVDLRVDDTTVLTAADCVPVRWRVEQIQAVALDNRAVVGEGARLSCDSAVNLEVTFQDGAQQTYTVRKQIRTSSLTVRALMVAALGALVAILLIGAAVRVHFLSRSLRFDESWTHVEFATQPPLVILQDYTAPNNHIFHPLLVHASTHAFGLFPWTLRLPVFFAGVLVVAATFAVARRFYGVRAALLASALAAGSSWMIEFSANARGYNVVTLCFLLMLLLGSSLRRRSQRRLWLLFALLGAVGMLTIPTMVYPLGLVCLWLGGSIALENRGRQRRYLLRDMALAVLLMLALTGLFYLPAFAYRFSGVRRNFDFNNVKPVDWGDFIGIFTLELRKV